MTMHMVAFGESVLAAGVLQSINTIPDPTVSQSGSIMSVPAKYNQVVAVGSLVTGNTMGQVQLRAPSLREMFFPDVAPFQIAANFSGADGLDEQFGHSLGLETNEGLEVYSDGGGDGTTAQDVVTVVVLSDGKVTPTSGKMYKLRATSAIQEAPLVWTNGPLVFSQTLPVGTYQIVGMTVVGFGLIAARLVFIGASAITRPGVFGQNSLADAKHSSWINGAPGVLGQFNSVTPPSVDILGGTSTSQSYELDLIKTG